MLSPLQVARGQVAQGPSLSCPQELERQRQQQQQQRQLSMVSTVGGKETLGHPIILGTPLWDLGCHQAGGSALEIAPSGSSWGSIQALDVPSLAPSCSAWAHLCPLPLSLPRFLQAMMPLVFHGGEWMRPN